MVVIVWKVSSFPTRLSELFSKTWYDLVLTFYSLCYNRHMSLNYATDILLTPLFWFVDNFAKSLGKVFVMCVSFLTCCVVLMCYWIGIPYWWERSPKMTIVLLTFGHWILMNIIFHYYMGVVTPPGFPPQATSIVEAASICKKCISPKPPRTHHCSVCDKCILGMDHHCPWLDNCVGYYNFRYFFLYMVYTLVGVIFLMIAGLDLAYVVIWLEDTGGVGTSDDPALFGHSVVLNDSGFYVPVENQEYDLLTPPRDHELPVPRIMEAQRVAAHNLKRKCVMFIAFICIAVAIVLGLLVITHSQNITKGESSIENHINAMDKKRLGQMFANPYDCGPTRNWKLILGFRDRSTFVKRVLLPSSHRPPGNGLKWNSIYYDLI